MKFSQASQCSCCGKSPHTYRWSQDSSQVLSTMADIVNVKRTIIVPCEINTKEASRKANHSPGKLEAGWPILEETVLLGGVAVTRAGPPLLEEVVLLHDVAKAATSRKSTSEKRVDCLWPITAHYTDTLYRVIRFGVWRAVLNWNRVYIHTHRETISQALIKETVGEKKLQVDKSKGF